MVADGFTVYRHGICTRKMIVQGGRRQVTDRGCGEAFGGTVKMQERGAPGTEGRHIKWWYKVVEGMKHERLARRTPR